MFPSRAASSSKPPPTIRPRTAGASIAVLLGLLALMTVVVTGDNGLTRADASIVAWTAQHRPGWLVEVARAVTLLGHGAILAVLLIATCIALVLRRVLPLRAALLPPIALAIGGGLNPLLKAIVDRPRPPIELRAVIEHSSGFPSGHSTQAASAWVALALVLWLWGRGHPRWPLLVAAALVGAVGITRVILAVHSPTDVLAGWCWGTAVALAVVSAAAYAERSAAPCPESPAPPTGPPATPPGDVTRSSASPAASVRCATTSGAR